jgi:LysR family transcriptional regulator, nitrogen assimilation regulatory protein
MDTRALRYFQTVAEFASYSRGAEFLRLSQPALSRAIKQLEQDLGTALFSRHGHGVTLTEAGRTLLSRTQAILRGIEQAREEVRGGSGGLAGTVSLAVPPAAGTYLVPGLVQRFGALHPNVSVKIVGGYSGYIHEWLVRGQVDLACWHDPVPQRGFEIVPLVQEPVFVVGRTGSFPPGSRAVRTEDLAKLPLILPSRPNASRRLLDGWMAARRLQLNLRMEVDDPSIIRALLRAGHGFSILSRGSFDTELRHGELEARPLRPASSWQFALVLPVHGVRPPAVTALANAIVGAARELTVSGAWPSVGRKRREDRPVS